VWIEDADQSRFQIMPRIVITVPDGKPQPYLIQLDRKSVTLGRGSINDIVLDCPSVSVKHAEMRRVEGGFELRDLESTNGIRFQGERRQVVVLHHGDSAMIGDVVFEYSLNDEEKEILGRERPQEESPIIKEPVEETEEESTPEPGSETSQPPAKERPKTSAGPSVKSIGCGWMLLTAIIALIAFCAGMAVRYEGETGKSMFDSIKERFESR